MSARVMWAEPPLATTAAGETHVSLIVARFGGLHPIARALGHRNPTTVQGWKDRGTIPQKHWPALQEAAEKRGFELSISDLSGLPA